MATKPSRLRLFFDGEIDEVRVYNRPLDEAEVQAPTLAAPIQDRPSVGPVAEYSFDEDPGEDQIEDLLGRRQHCDDRRGRMGARR